MNDKTKELETRKYILNKEELLLESYRQIPNDTVNFGEFIPFILTGLGGSQENKQLNWTNLVLDTLIRRIGILQDEIIKTNEKLEILIRIVSEEQVVEMCNQETNITDILKNLRLTGFGKNE